MHPMDTAERRPLPDDLAASGRNGREVPLRELDLKSLPCVKLPKPELHSRDSRRAPKPVAAQDNFEVDGAGWRVQAVTELPRASRPDPAFRRFYPIASGLLMLDDLGRAHETDACQAAALRYDRSGRAAARTGFHHRLYRLGVHPRGRGLLAMSSDCVLHAYDDDLQPFWRTALADTTQIRALRRRFEMDDAWLKNHIRSVALAGDHQRYLYTAVDEAWCLDMKGQALWGLKLPLREAGQWSQAAAATWDVAVELQRALALMSLAPPLMPVQLKQRYRELARRWHPDLNPGSPRADERMKALNSAMELLSDTDPKLLAGASGPTGRTPFPIGDTGFSVTFDFNSERFTCDWIYAADFGAYSNKVYLGSYSGRVVKVDAAGAGLRVYEVGRPPKRIIDTGEFLYILTSTTLYVLRGDALETLIEVRDGGELVPAQRGFGLLESKRLRWFGANGRLLGTVRSRDPIRRIYYCAAGLVVESRCRRALIGGASSWWD